MGILRRLRFDLLWMDRSNEKLFFTALDRLDEPIRTEVLDAFDQLPDKPVLQLDSEGIRRLLETVAPTEVDTLREIAAKVIPLKGSDRNTIMTEIFNTTSMAITTSPDEHNLRHSRFQQLISSYL